MKIIIAALPLRVENTLTTYRNSIIGSVPHTREQYDPHRVLQSITGGSTVLCLDSQNLPPDWKEIDLNELFEAPAGNVRVAEVRVVILKCNLYFVPFKVI